MSKTLAIYGAGGHGKVVADLAEQVGYTEIVFFDNNYPDKTKHEHWDVRGDFDALLQTASAYDGVIVAIGNNQYRLDSLRQLEGVGAVCVSLIHPTASVSTHASLGKGCVVFPQASVNAFAKIGDGVIINTNASVDHDAFIADGVHICPGVHLAGSVHIGKLSWVGIGSCVIQQIQIGERVFVAAGSVIVQDIADNQRVKGHPARPF